MCIYLQDIISIVPNKIITSLSLFITIMGVSQTGGYPQLVASE